jgi:hypothetical protein
MRLGSWKAASPFSYFFSFFVNDDRKLENQEEAIQLLQQRLPPELWEIQVFFEKISTCSDGEVKSRHCICLFAANKIVDYNQTEWNRQAVCLILQLYLGILA